MLGGDSDAFVTRMPGTLASVSQSTFLGGSDDEAARGLYVYARGAPWGATNIYLIGYTTSADFPVNNKSYDSALSGPSDGS